MFRRAVAMARDYTFPVVMSRRSHNGKCSGSIGAFVVVNEEGWAITAGHIADQIVQLGKGQEVYEKHVADEAAIRGDASLVEKERRSRLQQLTKLKPEDTTNGAVWWAGIATGIDRLYRVQGVDLAAVKLSGFDKSKVKAYPKFKEDGGDYLPGASLCKLGFPFFTGNPDWDDTTKSFTYAQGSLPPTLFPIEGMLTRMQQVQLVDLQGNHISSPIPLQNVETSTPGLKGQSGGPIFDTDGIIWALQCLTTHTALGFSPTISVNGQNHVEHQFINMGMGPSSITIASFLASQNISRQTAK